MRKFLYSLLKLSNDVRAVRKKRVRRRVKRRVGGRLFGKALRRIR